MNDNTLTAAIVLASAALSFFFLTRIKFSPDGEESPKHGGDYDPGDAGDFPDLPASDHFPDWSYDSGAGSSDGGDSSSSD